MYINDNTLVFKMMKDGRNIFIGEFTPQEMHERNQEQQARLEKLEEDRTKRAIAAFNRLKK